MEGISTKLIELSETKIKLCRITKEEDVFLVLLNETTFLKMMTFIKYLKNKRSRWHYTWFTRYHCRNERVS